MAPSAELTAGTELLGYRIERMLGRGGMGVVYLAHQLALDRFVALKLLAPELAIDEAYRDRFLRESRVAASLDHPNVVPVHDAGEVDGRLYIAMRYVEGFDLRRLVCEEGPLAPEQVIRLLAPVADALDLAHGRGLVHRDVKPSNILVDQAGRPYLADFGLTKHASERGIIEESHFAASVDYVAPEQIESEPVGPSADVYSLGCVLFECLTGEPPYRRVSPLATLWAQMNDPPPRATALNPELPARIDAIIERALAKEPGERYASCHDLADAAREALGVTEIVHVRSRLPLLLAAAGVALAVAAGISAYLLSRGSAGVEIANTADALVRIDPASGEVKQRFRFGHGVDGVEAGAGSVWVASVDDSAVWRLDPRTGKAQRITGLLEPHEVHISQREGFAYVGFRDGVAAIDLATGKEAGVSLKGGVAPAQIDVGPLGTWTTGFARDGFAYGDTVGKVESIQDFGSPSLPSPIPVKHTPVEGEGFEALADLAVGDSAVWAIGDLLEHALYRIDPETREITRYALPSAPGKVAVGSGAVWVTGVLDDVVWRVDPTTGKVTEIIRVGRAPAGISIDDGAIWVTSSVDGTVSRIDPEARRVTATIEVGGMPRGVAAVNGSVWVASRAG